MSSHLRRQWREAALRKSAMPQSWRPVTDQDLKQFGDAVITTQVTNPSRGDRYFEVYTYGQLIAARHSLEEAKRVVEEVYGPLQWRRYQNPPVKVVHYYFGPTTEFTEPTTYYTADLPMLGYAASRRHASANTVYRGFQVALPPHIESVVRRLSEPPTSEVQIGQSKRIGKVLVDWLQENHWDAELGLGRHWTRRHQMAQAAAMQGGVGGGWGIILTATYNPADENPDLTGTTPLSARIEEEVNLRPGAPLTVINVEVLGWRMPLIDHPIRAFASRKGAYNDDYLAFARGFKDFEQLSKAYSLESIRPRAWHLSNDKLFSIDPSFRPTNRSGGTTEQPVLFLTTAPEYWTDNYLSKRTVAIEYDITGLTYGTDYYSDRSGNDGIIVLPHAYHKLREVGRMSVAQAERNSANQDANSPQSKEEMRAIYDQSRTASRKTASATYYHGTVWPMSEGTVIVPSSKNPAGARNFDLSREDKIYLSDDMGEAYYWAAMAAANAPFRVQPRVYRVSDVENPTPSSAMGIFELLADSAKVAEDVTEQARAAWQPKAKSRYDALVDVGLEDTPQNRSYFLASKTAANVERLYDIMEHLRSGYSMKATRETNAAINILNTATVAYRDGDYDLALNEAQQARHLLLQEPERGYNNLDRAIRRFVARYADTLIKLSAHYPAASDPEGLVAMLHDQFRALALVPEYPDAMVARRR